MPTKQFEPILYRELRKVEVSQIIKITSPLLQEIVNYATNAFIRCEQTTQGSVPDEPLPVFNAYHQIISMIDGIEVLLSNSCVIPCIPMLRAVFEALLTLQYILEKDARKRSFAWLVCYLHNRIDMYERFDTTKLKGKQFTSNLIDEKLDTYFLLPPTATIQERIGNLESLLKKPHYVEAEVERKRMAQKKRKANWYSFYDGPSNIYELAKYLKKAATYDFLYRQWSSYIHSDDLSHFLGNNKKAILNVIRSSEDIQLICTFTATFGIESTRILLNHYRPGEMRSFGKWYITEIRDSYQKISSLKKYKT